MTDGGLPATTVSVPSPQLITHPVMVSAPGSDAASPSVNTAPASTLPAPLSASAGATLSTDTSTDSSEYTAGLPLSVTRTVMGTTTAPSAGVQLKRPVVASIVAPAGGPTRLYVSPSPSGSEALKSISSRLPSSTI